MDLTSPSATRGYSGKLIDHGQAPYDFMEENNDSYYATIEDPNGNQRTIWGKEIRGAVEEANVVNGDNITLKHGGKEDVTVDSKVYDGNGNVTGTQKINTHRNIWKMTKEES